MDKSEHRARLRSALVAMAIRYGQACVNQGGACFGDDATWERWSRIRDRRFAAMMRLNTALARIDE